MQRRSAAGALESSRLVGRCIKSANSPEVRRKPTDAWSNGLGLILGSTPPAYEAIFFNAITRLPVAICVECRLVRRCGQIRRPAESAIGTLQTESRRKSQVVSSFSLCDVL